MKCSEKITDEERQIIFDEFWALADINRQRDYISKLVTVQEKNRSRKHRLGPQAKTVNPPFTKDVIDLRESEIQGPSVGKNENPYTEENAEPSRRCITYTYKLQCGEKRVVVCKTFFINTLSISGQMVQTTFAKIGTTGVVLQDRRGKACKNSKLEESVKESVRDHINSFETVESHYCRKSSSRKYLPSTLNVSKMFSMYQEYCQENNISQIASQSIYRQVFDKEFNLSFFKPKKDLCDLCHKYETSSGQQKAEMEENYNEHIKNKELSRQIKNHEKELANQDRRLCVANFDLQQVLSTPKSNVGLAYYKLKLATYNFTVFNLASKECDCYMWYECLAKRGSSEIGSCLFHFITSQVSKGFQEFSFFSDNCAGQNRNKNLFSLYNFLSQKYSITIRHTYLEVGHTQTEGDSVHSLIERMSKNIPVYTPDQWYSIVRTAKRVKPHYSVHELSQNDIYDLQDLQQKTTINFDRDENNEKVLISKFKIIQFTHEHPNILFFKMRYDEVNFKQLNLVNKGRKQFQFDPNSIQLQLLYSKKLPLQKKKYDHLKYLCEKGVIVSQYHDFYKNLPFTNQTTSEDSD